jgi:hypothetical protein
VAVVFHDASVKAGDKYIYDSYVRYGRQLEKMLGELRALA